MAVATEAMESVEFKIFVVMNALSFFPSMGVVLVVLQAMAMENINHSHRMKVVMSLCNRVAYMALGSAAIAFVSAAITFTR
ncbi:hypothetical protein KI387_017547, partial [Taxus chinensis]